MLARKNVKKKARDFPGLDNLDELGLVRQNSQQEQGHDVGDLDHGVYGWARGVLVGVAYGVAGDAGLVGFGALQVLHAL